MLRYSVFLIVLMISLPCRSSSSDLFAFNGLSFGDFPEQDMICVAGGCDPETAAITFKPSKKTVITTYLREKDLSYFGRVPLVKISYDYFEDKLFRIRLTMACKPQETSACIEAGLDELMLTYSMGQLTSKDYEGGILQRSYVIDESIMVIGRTYYNQSDRWFPNIEIYDKSLIDKVRRFANPKFKPMPIGGK